MASTAKRAAGIVGLLVAVTIGLYLSILLYLAYEAHRVSEMLTALNGIHIGDLEESALSAVEGFGGYRWNQPDKAQGEYEYVVEVNPWYFPMAGHQPRFERVATRIIEVIDTSPSSRRAVGLRLWTAGGSIDIY